VKLNITSAQLTPILAAVSSITSAKLAVVPNMDAGGFARDVLASILTELQKHAQIVDGLQLAEIIERDRGNMAKAAEGRRRWRVIATDFHSRIRMATPDDRETQCFLVEGFPPPVDQ
jgi:hypothetical protein